MELIRVPAPPKAAFNMQRPMSDLIKAQIKHLKHVEHGLPQTLRETLPQHPIVTESDAAIYIASMTTLLRSRADTPKRMPKQSKPGSRPIPIVPSGRLALVAAAGQTSKKDSPKGGPSRTTRKSSSRKNTATSSKRKK
jgi:hypothetical protein